LDTRKEQAHAKMAATVRSIPVGVVTVGRDHKVQFMNTAAEQMTGGSLEAAQGKQLYELLNITDSRLHALPELDDAKDASPIEEFGCSLSRDGGTSILVDMTITPLKDQSGRRSGFVITLRDAAERLRTQAVEEALHEVDSFHLAPTPMVQLDSTGMIVRLNEAMIKKTGMDPSNVVGRSLTALTMDPDPRIARDFVHKVMQSDTSVATGRPLRMH
jgi:PAS domain S-box-containing protein